MALQRPVRRALLTLTWELLVEDPVAEGRLKPLELIGHALTEPHAHSLAAVLRSRGLVPLAIEIDWPKPFHVWPFQPSPYVSVMLRVQVAPGTA